MRPEIAWSVPAEAWEILDKIRQIVSALPEMIEVPAFVMGVKLAPDIATANTIPNCHVITHAIAPFFPVEAHDGFVSIIHKGKRRDLKHSWLTLRGDDSIIIDPWPLGSVGGPSIFIQDYAYHFGPECSFLENRSEEFLCHVETVTAAVRLAILGLKLTHIYR